jgi:Zn-dependent peptidase ImmA (M78 family)
LTFPVEFFSGADLAEPAALATSFRALSRLTAQHRDQATGSATLALALAGWIEARFKLPSPDVPRYPDINPELAADAVREVWGLGERPIGNMVHLLEAHGVRVFSLIDECHDVDAFSFWRGETPYVFLNTAKSAERGRMDSAHELGHLVLHRGHALPSGRLEEQEANAFGAAFLMPRRSVLAHAPRGGHLDDLIRAKRYWNVAAANLAYRMHKVGLLTDWQYRTIFVNLSSQGYRNAEPNGIHRETSQMLGKVFESLRSEGMQQSDVARELQITVQDLTKIIFGLVLTPVAGTATADGGGPGIPAPSLRIV